MTKLELVQALADDMGMGIRHAGWVVDTILATMPEALSRGEGRELRGFGSFSIRRYGAYVGKNPNNGERIKVQPKRLPFFKVGQDLRQTVDRNKCCCCCCHCPSGLHPS